MIVLMGATGNTGKVAAEALLSRGEKVRVLGRDAKKLQPFAARGAEVAAGDAADPAFLARAFAGADTAYTLIPPDMRAPDFRAHQDRVGEATVQALRQSGVKRVVFLSSVGADLPAGTGPIVGLHAQEERLRGLGVDLLLLRPGYFFENLYASLPLIRHQGINGSAIAPEVKLSMIATRDIGAAAAAALAAKDFSGVQVRNLLGPRDYTMVEVTRILGAKIGKPDLAYVQFPYEAFGAALEQAGLTKDMARLYVEMSRAFNAGIVKPVGGRTPESTTPTPFESFASELAAAYEAGR
ncbi:MAG: NAD(P)H-binding protein [Deltaproteobacteria bacterium]|nr:NAD(P)H-binding protein [Deltaproteobacteria bacterium]